MLFGTSGIRGRFGREVTPDLVLLVSNAISADRKRIIVGRDGRTTSYLLSRAAVSGVLSAGADCIDCGLIPTPTLSYATKLYGDAGIMITASHNPAEDNGMKAFQKSGMSFTPAQEQKIEAVAASKKYAYASWDKQGQYSQKDAVEKYISKVVRSVKLQSCLKVVVDPGNGPTSLVTPEIFKRLGCTVVVINGEIDGTFPSRPSEPEEKNLSALKAAVRRENADLGVAHDGDGDRHAVIDENGAFVDQEKLLALVYKRYGGKVVTTVDGSMILEQVAGKKNVIRTRVGDVAVAEGILKSKANFGGESSSGCWIHPKVHLGPDGPLSAAVIASIVSRKGALSELISQMPETFVMRKKYAVRNKAKAMSGVGKRLNGRSPLTIDGYRIDKPEGWYLIRASGTQNLIRISVEGRTRKDADNLLKEAEKLLQDAK
ncbi:MAG: phosphoglucosamine mutase [archaeon]